jgi:hypothetical protein
MADAGQRNILPPPKPLPPQQDVFPPRTSRSSQGLRDDPNMYVELLVTPIMLDRFKEVTSLDGMCEELLREAQNIEKENTKTPKFLEDALKYR